MAMYLTIARPYAKAVFAEAKASKQFESWTDVLNVLAIMVQDALLTQTIDDPKLSQKQLIDLLLDIVDAATPAATNKLGDKLYNFLWLLIDEKRLNTLTDIAVLYHQLVIAEQGVVEAELIAAFDLSDDQCQQIQAGLAKRFNAKVVLNVSKDESLIGGAIIRAGNWVMDGSIQGKLAKLADSLM